MRSAHGWPRVQPGLTGTSYIISSYGVYLRITIAAARDGPGFSLTREPEDGPPGGYGTWRLRTPGPGPDLIVEFHSLSTQDCDHRFQAKGHDPGVKLRHLAQIRHAACTSPVCRRPASQCDFEHNVPFEAGGGRACVMAVRSVGMTTGSSSSRGGRWTSCRTGPSVDDPIGTRLPHRTHPVPDLTSLARELASGKLNAFN